jgi:hypothetical protein
MNEQRKDDAGSWDTFRQANFVLEEPQACQPPGASAARELPLAVRGQVARS